MAVAGAAGARGYKGGWLDPVPTPVLLTTQIWSTMPGRQSVLGFYGPNARYGCFSNFAEEPVAEEFEFELPDGLIPDGVRETFDCWLDLDSCTVVLVVIVKTTKRIRSPKQDVPKRQSFVSLSERSLLRWTEGCSLLQ